MYVLHGIQINFHYVSWIFQCYVFIYLFIYLFIYNLFLVDKQT